jgi:3-oxoadipate enol-lactonase
MQHYVTVRRRRVRFLEAGHGRPVVFIHAFPLAADMWVPQLAAVTHGWRFVAPDLRGFGGSARLPDSLMEQQGHQGATTIDTHADDILQFLDALAIPKATVVGLSMGGYVALALHRRAAGRVDALVLCDTRSTADTDAGRENRQRMLADLEQHGPAAVAHAMLPKLLGPASLAQPSGAAATAQRLMAGSTREGLADAIVCLMTRPDATPALVNISCPTLLVVGRDDELTPVADHEAMHRAIAGSRLEVIDGAGHLSNLEQPAAFNRIVFEFFESLVPAGHA